MQNPTVFSRQSSLQKMKYPIVLQHSEEDCGAACIATVAKHYGRTFAISRIREAVGTGDKSEYELNFTISA